MNDRVLNDPPRPDLAHRLARNFGWLSLQELAIRLLGLATVALLGAFMSTVDTHLNLGASYMVNDIYRRFLVKGGAQTQVEGNSPERHVIIAFPDRQTAIDWYNSEAYQRILPIALSSSSRDIVIVDGVD